MDSSIVNHQAHTLMECYKRNCRNVSVLVFGDAISIKIYNTQKGESNMQRFVDSANIVNDAPERRKRMDRDGYLFVSGLLPCEPLEDVRIKLLKMMRDEG